MVGKAIEHVVEEERKNGTFPKGAKERFVYLSSKDGDLRSREQTDAIFAKHKYESPVTFHVTAFLISLTDLAWELNCIVEDYLNSLFVFNLFPCSISPRCVF